MFEVLVTEQSQVAEARRRASAAATAAGFGETAAGRVALVATELASNLVKHGGGGRLLVDATDHHADLLALDSGAGIADLGRCLADGYSTAGTAGNGLGALQRLAHPFAVVSWPGRGTAMLARVHDQQAVPALPAGYAEVAPGALAGLVVPRPGETACGDAWSHADDAVGRTVFVVDGLGHGMDAARAANEAVAQFQRSRHQPPDEIVHAVHGAIRHTRGAAVGVARIHWASATVSFAGVGNIASTFVPQAPGQPVRRMVSHNGIVGHNARKIQAFDYPCGDGLLVMHSDGIATSWNLATYPGLLQAHPLLVAGVLYRDFARGRDDATAVVVDTRPPRGAVS